MTAQFQFFQSLPHKKADFVKKKAGRTWGTMSRADEGAAFTCSWRDRLTGRETLWGNKGVPKTKEGHNQSQIPLRTSLPPIGAESPGVQVALSTNSVSVSRSNTSDLSL